VIVTTIEEMNIRTRGSSRLTKGKRKELTIGLCRALSVLKSPEEMAEALTDLLTPKEVEMISKRLQIAEYLAKGWEYEIIRKELKVGYSTIARVNTWLNLSGKGYKMMLTRRKKSPKPKSEQELYDPYSWHNVKRRYSMHFWPQLLLEEVIRTSDKKQRKKISDALDKLDIKKQQFSRKANKQMYEMFSKDLKTVKRKKIS